MSISNYRKMVNEVAELYRGTPREKAELAYPPARFFFRPASFLTTPALINLGLTANQVTLLGVTVNVGGLLLLASGGYWAMLAGGCALVCAGVLDYSDGNIARYRRNFTLFGKFLDGLADSIIVLHFIAVAIGLSNTSEPKMMMIAAAATTWLALLLMYVEMRYMAFFAEAKSAGEAAAGAVARDEKFTVLAGRLTNALFLNWVLGAPLIVLAAAVSGQLRLYLLAAFVIYLIYVPLKVAHLIVRAKRTMSVSDVRSAKIGGESSNGRSE